MCLVKKSMHLVALVIEKQRKFILELYALKRLKRKIGSKFGKNSLPNYNLFINSILYMIYIYISIFLYLFFFEFNSQ